METAGSLHAAPQRLKKLCANLAQKKQIKVNPWRRAEPRASATAKIRAPTVEITSIKIGNLRQLETFFFFFFFLENKSQNRTRTVRNLAPDFIRLNWCASTTFVGVTQEMNKDLVGAKSSAMWRWRNHF